ncbi:MAG: hypothetical protein OSB09_05970 [Planctomycetota bacterium]|nr:hypothetical protein [Planctomycetota bacterium]
MNSEPDENFEKEANEAREVDEKSSALAALQVRFGTRDGVSMIPERLGPQEIQWLGCWFMSCGRCGSGCGGGEALEFIAPIFDSKLDLWGRKQLAMASSRRSAIEAFSATLFAHGLHAGLELRKEAKDSATFDELLEVLGHYNHADCSEGTMDQIDPTGFSSTWPQRWLEKLQKLYPSLLLTLNALRRIAVVKQSSAEVPQHPFQLSPPRENRTMPVGLRIFFFAGAIAAGVTPGCSGMPFPFECAPAQVKGCEEENAEENEIPF